MNPRQYLYECTESNYKKWKGTPNTKPFITYIFHRRLLNTAIGFIISSTLSFFYIFHVDPFLMLFGVIGWIVVIIESVYSIIAIYDASIVISRYGDNYG